MSLPTKKSSIPDKETMPVQKAMSARSKIERNYLGHFKKPFDYGAKVINQELSSCISSSGGSSPSCSSKESGIGSVTSNSPIPLTLKDYFLLKLEAMQYGDALEIVEKFARTGKVPIGPENPKEKPYPVYTWELNWAGRNLLDLGANLQGNAIYQPATLSRGVLSYFENRSQISRVNGARTPPHITKKCPFPGCEFETQFFY